MRLMQGFASAPFETLVTSTVQDIFFVHERGQKLAVWGFMITTGVLLVRPNPTSDTYVLPGYF
jgi:hypothetical protein